MRCLCSAFYAFFAALLVLLPVRLVIAAQPPPASYNYLFAIDTSETMATHKTEIARFAGQTIRGGFDGWMHRNETIGFWTFNQNITRDAFPVALWTTNEKEQIAEQAEELLFQARFGGMSRLDLALAEFQRFAANSEEITIFIISNNCQPIRGTPFDRPINLIYSSLAGSGAVPAVVTRLTAHHGEFSAWSVQLLEKSGAEIRLVDLAPLETRFSGSTSASIDTASGSPASNLAGNWPDPRANVGKAMEPAVEKQLPPPPVLPPELLAAIRVAPLQFERDDEPGKPRKSREPILILPAKPSSTTPNTSKPAEAAVATHRVLEEKEKNPPISTTAAEPVNNLIAPVTEHKTEPHSESRATKLTAAMARTTLETLVGTNAFASDFGRKTESKAVTEPGYVTLQRNGRASTDSVAPVTPQVRTAERASENKAAKPPEQKAQLALGPSETKSATPAASLTEGLLKPSLAMAPLAPTATHTFLFAGLALLIIAGLLIWVCCRISRAPRRPSLISRGFDRGTKQNHMNAPKLLDTHC